MATTAPEQTKRADVAKTAAAPPPAERPDAAQARLHMDAADLKSSYCNFCNANSTREEVVLAFGINQNWEVERGSDMSVKLQHRIILSPFAAKRLAGMLAQLMREYESRYGELK